MPDLMEKRRSGWVLLAVCALIASLLAVEVNPATAVEETADHLASASACEGEAETDRMFTDVPAGHTFRDAINCIAYHGITVGTGDGTTFSPNDDVTRWQMALFIARAMKAAGVDLGAVVDAGFTDIGDAPAVLRDAINQLAANGVIPEADTYRPNDPMTRADMTIFLVGFLDKAAPNVTITEDGVIMLGTGSAAAEADDHFADVRALSSPSVDRAAAALWELGVTRGTNKAAAVVDPTRTPLDVKYDPQSTVTRGAMAAFITRALAHTSLAPATTTVDPPEAAPPGSSASGGSGGSGGSGRSPTTTTTAPGSDDHHNRPAGSDDHHNRGADGSDGELRGAVVHRDRGRRCGDRAGGAVGGCRAHRDCAADGDKIGRSDNSRLHAAGAADTGDV